MFCLSCHMCTLFATQFDSNIYLWLFPFIINFILMVASFCHFYTENWALEKINQKFKKLEEFVNKYCGFNFFIGDLEWIFDILVFVSFKNFANMNN